MVEVLDCYFKACSIRVNSKDLANIAFVLANHGKALQSDEQLFPPEYARYVNAIMMTCGMYDWLETSPSGWGIPAKSGVGGIMGVRPHPNGGGDLRPGPG